MPAVGRRSPASPSANPHGAPGADLHRSGRPLLKVRSQHRPSRLAYGDGTLWAYGQEATFTSWLDLRTGAHHPYAIPTIGCSGTTAAGQPAYWCVSFAPQNSSYTGPPTVAARFANHSCS